MLGEQGILPTLDGPALVAGPVFVCFEIEGEPRGKGRHRSRIVFPRSGKPFIHMYPDPETASYEGVIADIGKLFMRGKQPTEKPVALLVHAFRAVPKSWSDKDRNAALSGSILPTSRPDGDNYLKIAQDGLNKIVWADDAQVVDARAIKLYSSRPALRIEVREYVVA